MDSKKVKVEDFVWAKMERYAPWPALIMEPSEDVPAKPTRGEDMKDFRWIYFFGTHNYAWIEESKIWPYEEFKEQHTKVNKGASFKRAVEELDGIINNVKEDPNYKIEYVKYASKSRKSSSGSASKRKTPTGKRSKTHDNTPTPQPKKRRKLILSTDDTNSEVSGRSSARASPGRYPPREIINSGKMSYISGKDVKTSPLSFGFLGIGIIGGGIVKNLITSGHKVNIWNRDSRKCKQMSAYVTAHAGYVRTYESPRDVAMNSHIIFSCLSDPEVEMKVLQAYFGVDDKDDDILEGKGYVTLTTIDPESSETIRELIENKDGKYLEAQLQGSKKEAQDGSMIVLTAGNWDLFKTCQSCFKAMGTNSFYLGDVGYATKVNLILQLIKSTCLVGLTEGLALADRCDISPQEFVNIFKLTSMASPYLTGKAQMVTQRKFSDVEHALQYMQKDIRLGLELSNKVKQPMVLGSAANEVFKSARRFGYDTHDVACIYMRMRH